MAAPNIYLGTSGWSYPSGYGKWAGIFYPKKFGGDELAYYAERFPAVEVNASFYRVPSVETARGWGERTPARFRFTMKLFRKFTHPDFYAREEGQSPEITAEDVRAMRGVLDALAGSGKLGALLVQYPDFFYQNTTTIAALTRTLDHFRDYPLAVELRNRSWENERTREVLAQVNAAYVRIDEPLYRNPDEPFAPADTLQYWRFHGRNTAEWRKPGAGNKRYDYLYAAEEIDDLHAAIERHLQPGHHTYVFFNNHPGGKAAANAIQLAARMGLPLPYQKFAPLANTFPDLQSITGDESGQMRLPG